MTPWMTTDLCSSLHARVVRLQYSACVAVGTTIL